MADDFFRIAYARNEGVNLINYTITLQKTIPVDAIVRHYYPIRIKDPLKHYAVWNDEIMEYE